MYRRISESFRDRSSMEVTVCVGAATATGAETGMGVEGTTGMAGLASAIVETGCVSSSKR